MLRDHAFYLTECYKIARNSGDPSTRNGAVLVDPASGDIVAYGWNHLPRGLESHVKMWERPAKYKWVIHAEQAAINYAACIGQMTFGLWLYCPWSACRECAKGIADTHVARLIRHKRPEFDAREDWIKSVAEGDAVLMKAGVTIVEMPELVGSEMLFDGRMIQV